MGPPATARPGAEAERRAALDLALRFLAPRPRSRAEVADRLNRAGVGREATAFALSRLVEVGLLDDDAFARWWVDNRCRHRPRARRALAHELTARGVDRDAVGAALAGVDDEELAVDVALARGRRLAAEEERAAFDRRVGGHLARRGFSGGTVRRALDAAWRRLRPA